MQQPSKQQLMIHMLEDAWVYVHLDPRRDGVILPDHLRLEKRLVLQYGYNMPVPIDNFNVDERGISATLSFRRVPCATFIPWAAVFAVTDGDKRTWVWQEDMPADLNLEEGAAEPAQPNIVPARGKTQTRGAAAASREGRGGDVVALPRSTRAKTITKKAAPAEAPPEGAAEPSEGEEPRAAASSASSSGAAAGKPGKKPRPSYLKLVD